MKQKNNNRLLLVLLAIVAMLIIALEIYERSSADKNRENLTGINIEKITRIAMSNAKADQCFSLRKEEIGWFITADKIQIPIENQSIEKVLLLLKEMKPIKKVSSKKEDWAIYETIDESGLRITAYNAKDILVDFFIGKVEKDEETGLLTTYVRLQGDVDTYAVNGDVKAVMTQDFFGQIFPLIDDDE